MRTSGVLVATIVLLSSRMVFAQAAAGNTCGLDVVEALGDQGEWLSVRDYGPAWRPFEAVVGANFVPFVTGGAFILRDGQPFFSSRWAWGDIVFSSGRWTLNANEGWIWIPDERCLVRSNVAQADDDPMPLPPLLNPTRVRTIKHPLGTQYAYPYGQEWGRVFPAGVKVLGPTWLAPISTTPTTLVPGNRR